MESTAVPTVTRPEYAVPFGATPVTGHTHLDGVEWSTPPGPATSLHVGGEFDGQHRPTIPTRRNVFGWTRYRTPLGPRMAVEIPADLLAAIAALPRHNGATWRMHGQGGTLGRPRGYSLLGLAVDADGVATLSDYDSGGWAFRKFVGTPTEALTAYLATV